MARRQIAVLAGALLTLTGLAACEGSQLGAAAIVDEQKITVTELQGALARVREAQERFNVPVDQDSKAAVNELHRRVIVLIYAKAADALGITITEGELSVRAAELRKQAGGDDAYERNQVSFGKTPDVADDDIRLQLIESKMAAKLAEMAGRTLTRDELVAQIQDRLVTAAKGMSIRLNPRYGTFNPVEGSVEPYRYDYFRPPPASSATVDAG